ncbi:MAG: outer membrane lipid asymmetry maintenance protein MlaD [Pseudomonadales bacterium]
MVSSRTVEISVGLFMVAAVLALTALAFKVSGLSVDGSRPTYRLVAKFDNVADLHARAKVSISGVVVGRVVSVGLDPISLRATVNMDIYQDVGYFPEDSIAVIQTAGLLGDKFIGISIGGAEEELKNDDEIEDTQSALVLEDLIGKVVSSLGGDK